jgi:hypothetical protein
MHMYFYIKLFFGILNLDFENEISLRVQMRGLNIFKQQLLYLVSCICKIVLTCYFIKNKQPSALFKNFFCPSSSPLCMFDNIK